MLVANARDSVSSYNGTPLSEVRLIWWTSTQSVWCIYCNDDSPGSYMGSISIIDENGNIIGAGGDSYCTIHEPGGGYGRQVIDYVRQQWVNRRLATTGLRLRGHLNFLGR